MAKTITLIFTGSPNVTLNESINLSIDTGSSIITFSETFKVARLSSFEVTLTNQFDANQQAINFANAWNLDYKITSSDPSVKDDLKAIATDNVVTIIAKTDDWDWQIPTGSSITSGSIDYNIPLINNVNVTSYNESSNPCNFVDVVLNIDGGTAPYDIYKGNTLLFSGVTSEPTITLPRDISYNLTIFDSLLEQIGIVEIANTLKLTEIEIETVENGLNLDVTIVEPIGSVALNPYLYSLNGVDYNISNVFTNVTKGSYTAYVKDALGCVTTKDFLAGDGLIYYSDFKDVVNVNHRLEIYKDSYVETPREITSEVLLDYPDCKENQEAIKVCGLTINLLADENLTFTDLYSEEERVFKVVYKRNDITLFNGFLSPDGLYESYTDSKWYIELQAIDGIGYLKDLSYVEDSTGLPFIGKQKDLEVIVNCLKRTKLDNGIRTSVNIFYTGISGVNILDNVYVNSERFIKDDEDTLMDCEEVLRSVLEKYNASITFFEGYWYIYRSNELFDNANVNFYNYDSDGNYIDIVTKNISFSVGSQINNFYPHHANYNQQKSIERSLGAYKSNLKWGNVFPYYTNTSLVWTDSTTISDWTINRPSGVTSVDGRGFFMTRDVEPIQVILTSDNYTVASDNRVEFKVTFSNENNVDFIGNTGSATINLKIIYVKGGNTYWLDRNGKFGSDNLIQYAISFGEKDFTLRIVSDVLPEAEGYFYIQLWTPGFGSAVKDIFISEIILQTFAGQGEAIGKNFTIQKKLNPAPSTNDDIKEVMNGDVVDGTYYATIYENDQITETTTWHRKFKDENKELLRIMAEDRMKMNWLPKIVFEGDYFGYVPYFCVCNIDNVNGKYMAIDYIYDAKNNITSVKYLQLLNADITDDDIIYSSTLDYGNVVKPTIKG